MTDDEMFKSACEDWAKIRSAYDRKAEPNPSRSGMVRGLYVLCDTTGGELAAYTIRDGLRRRERPEPKVVPATDPGAPAPRKKKNKRDD